MIKRFSFKQISLSKVKTKLNGSKYCYPSPIVQLNISHFFGTYLKAQTVVFLTITFSNEGKCFQILLSITNNLIKRQSFVYTQCNDETIGFLTIQFSTSNLFAWFKCQTILFDPWIGHYRVLPSKAREDLGAMAIKGIPHSPKFQCYWSLTISLLNAISGHS